MTTTQCLHPVPLPQTIGKHYLTTRTNIKNRKRAAGCKSLEFCRIRLPPIDHVTFSNLRAGSFERFCLVLRVCVCVWECLRMENKIQHYSESTHIKTEVKCFYFLLVLNIILRGWKFTWASEGEEKDWDCACERKWILLQCGVTVCHKWCECSNWDDIHVRRGGGYIRNRFHNVSVQYWKPMSM